MLQKRLTADAKISGAAQRKSFPKLLSPISSSPLDYLTVYQMAAVIFHVAYFI